MTFLKILERERPVVLFTLLYLIVTSYYTWLLQNWEFQLYVFIVFLLLLVIISLHTFVQFSKGVLWTLSFWGLLHLLGGLVTLPSYFPIFGSRPVLYNLWLVPGFFKYDNLMHLYGYGIATWVIWQVSRTIVTEKKATWLSLLIVVMAANGLGAGNEIVEFFASRVLTETNIGGYIDTGWDLVYNLVGSVAAAFIIRYGHPHTSYKS